MTSLLGIVSKSCFKASESIYGTDRKDSVSSRGQYWRMEATAGLFRNRQSCKLSSLRLGACLRNHSNSRSGIAHELNERLSSAGGDGGGDNDDDDDDWDDEEPPDKTEAAVVDDVDCEPKVGVLTEVVPRRLARRALISKVAFRSRE